MTTKANPTISFLFVMTLCFVASFIATEVSLRGLSDSYPFLPLPRWCPPAWGFNPAWTVNSAILGFAGWTVLKTPRSESEGRARLAAASFFVANLILSTAWAWGFFAGQKLLLTNVFGLGAFVVLLLTALCAATFNRKASLLFLLPLAWSIYSLAISFVAYRLSR